MARHTAEDPTTIVGKGARTPRGKRWPYKDVSYADYIAACKGWKSERISYEKAVELTKKHGGRIPDEIEDGRALGTRTVKWRDKLGRKHEIRLYATDSGRISAYHERQEHGHRQH